MRWGARDIRSGTLGPEPRFDLRICMRKMKLVLLSLLVFLGLLSALFCCLELTFRYFDRKGVTELPYHTVTGTYLPLIMKPYYRGNIAGVPVAMNRYGLRDEPDFDSNPATGEYRILSLGDSIAFGLGIPSSGAYAKVLDRRLNELPGAQK
jgi:hypothetical protein